MDLLTQSTCINEYPGRFALKTLLSNVILASYCFVHLKVSCSPRGLGPIRPRPSADVYNLHVHVHADIPNLTHATESDSESFTGEAPKMTILHQGLRLGEISLNLNLNS